MSHQPTVFEHEHTDGHGGHGDHEPSSPGNGSRMVRDPVCGMMVDAATALRSDIGGRTFFFCSSGCQRTFEAPDEELRRMKRRVTIAMTGAKRGPMADLADLWIAVPHAETQKIQEGHIVLGHIFCALAEEKIHGDHRPN